MRIRKKYKTSAKRRAQIRAANARYRASLKAEGHKLTNDTARHREAIARYKQRLPTIAAERAAKRIKHHLYMRAWRAAKNARGTSPKDFLQSLQHPQN